MKYHNKRLSVELGFDIRQWTLGVQGCVGQWAASLEAGVGPVFLEVVVHYA